MKNPKRFVQFKTLDGIVSPNLEAPSEGLTHIVIRAVHETGGVVSRGELPDGEQGSKTRRYRLVEVAQLYIYEELDGED